MRVDTTSYTNKIFIALCLIIYIVMYGVMVKYFNNPYLWFDEAGQFWISKGLNHDSDPMSVCGGLYEVIVNNRNYNLDPGGFSIILHYWSMISSHHLWLRLLPFTFFILTNISFAILSYRWTKNKYVAMLMGMVPFLIPMILNEAFELRAYSMELLGCVTCVLAMDSLQKKISITSLIIWSLLISVFLTSRYSFIVVAFLTSLYVLYLIFRQNIPTLRKWLMSILYGAPLFLFLAFDYFTALRFQNPQLDTLSYLPYISKTPSVIFTRSSVILIISLLLISYLTVILKKYEVFSKYKGLIFVTLGTNILFFIFSVFGMHPWEGSCTRCISMVTLVVLTLCAFSGEACSQIGKIQKYKHAKYIALLGVSLMLLSISSDLRLSYRARSNAYIELLSTTNHDRIYVDRWESPCMRYLFEYGKLKNDARFDYPQSFTFAKAYSHSLKEKSLSFGEWYKQTQPSLNDLYDEYDVLVVPELYIVINRLITNSGQVLTVMKECGLRNE